MLIPTLYSIAGVSYALRDRFLVKSADPIKRVICWHGIEFGITHDANVDTRHGKPMSAWYGHLRGSYGDAEDGMAIDFYFGKNPSSDRVFRVKQIKPDTGDLDEWKYVVWVDSEDEAKALYLAHMPRRFFGAIESVSLSSLTRKYARN